MPDHRSQPARDPHGRITKGGVRKNIDVALRYLEFWLHGNGCVPIYGLMEDAATAEICGAQLWQWIRYGARLYDGRIMSTELHNDGAGQHHERAVRLDGGRGLFVLEIQVCSRTSEITKLRQIPGISHDHRLR
jgi:malate synthase